MLTSVRVLCVFVSWLTTRGEQLATETRDRPQAQMHTREIWVGLTNVLYHFLYILIWRFFYFVITQACDVSSTRNGRVKCWSTRYLMVLAFTGNKRALIKGFQYSKAARLHSGGRPSALYPDQLIRIQMEDVSQQRLIEDRFKGHPSGYSNPPLLFLEISGE